ncbi:helix-turn-helix domain-containing protein [Streptomyces sp.]|uniref:helix-turn-helix domain-containing protein n=1 Tax=Streptomyces sp. TaxID=1931 RepID=UPI002D775CEF|nr:helix-turn-helix domain-containing protein [Streptomyces sp.]HET6356395.1 helix-turn-helix domain-containing protein [Streptomyces sp.]
MSRDTTAGGTTVDHESPEPQAATSAAEFVAAMRQLRQWAHLSYRQLERRAQDAGDILPRATLAGVLNRQELPREELLAAFVRACGGDEATLEAWIRARKRLAVDLERLEGPDTISGRPGEPGAGPNAVGDSEPDPDEDPSDEQRTGAATEVSVPDTVMGQAASRVGPPAPAGDEAVGTGTTAAAEAGGEPSKSPATRRGRRPAVIMTLTMVVLVLAAGVTGIALLPGEDSGRQQQPKAPAVTTSASPAPTRTAKPVTARPSAQKDVAEAPSPRKKTPAASPAKGGSRPTPKPSSSATAWTPHEPDPWQPPSSTPSSPPAATGDPFPEETCWDANDCP